MQVGVLGPLTLAGADRVQLRDRTVLGVLVVRSRMVVSSDEIAHALWRDSPPSTYRKVIQGSVVRLRRALGPEAIATQAGGYVLQLPDDGVDAWCFETEVDAARDLLMTGYAARAADQVRTALARWRGNALPELESWPPAEAEVARLNELRESAEDLQLEAQLSAGYAPAAAAAAETTCARAPYRELRWSLWARALYADGRQADALAVLAKLRSTLREDLGVDTSPQVVQLETAILRQELELAIEPAVATGSECPWPGLLPYEEGDVLFGRDAELEAAIAKVSPAGGLAVVGGSGCGKSSLVRAALAPRLHASVITPGRHPLSALDGVPNGALIVDQCEEVVTQCADLSERREFFDRLCRRPEAVVVVARADVLDELASYPGFASLLERGLLVLRPMTAHGLRTMIEATASAAGLRLEPGLAEVLLAECQDQPAALPLLSHALAQTWERAEGNTLTVAGYRASGGVSGAVSATAEAVFRALPPPQQLTMRRLFRRLVDIEGGGVTRVRVPRGDFDDSLVDTLLSARLLSVTEGGDLQLAHEALGRHWPRLRGWLSEDQAGRRVLLHLASEASDWNSSKRPEGALYRGVRLEAAVSWAETHDEELAPAERDFLEASQQAASAELRHARRTNRRLAVALATSAVLLPVAVAGGGLALHQARRAEAARAVAERESKVSESLRLGALAESAEQPAIAFGLAAEALAVDDSPSTRSHVLRVFGHFPALLSTGVRPPRTDWPAAVPRSVSPRPVSSADGRLRAVIFPRGIEIRATGTGELVTAIHDLISQPNALAFDPAGRLLAGGISEVGFANTGTTLVWDVATGNVIGRFKSGNGPVWAHRFGADGMSIYAYGADGLHQWDLSGSRALARSVSGAPAAFRAGDQLFTVRSPSVDAWIAEACQLAGRPLTPSEWTEYVGGRAYRPTCSSAS